ncbi:MAG: diguanylate cyclase [Actinomycetota bacterium]|nr:diguanylate cyclase [Actinomycetota bacterium]
MPQQHELHDDAMLADILNRMPERVVRFRLPERTIVYCNPSWAHGHGSTPAEMVGRRMDDLLTDGELVGLHHQLGRLNPDTPVLADDVPRPAPEAPGRWIAWMDQLLEHGTEVLAVGRDVTELHRTSLALRASEERFRDLADRSADVVFHLAQTPSPHLTYLSPSVEYLLGYTPEELMADFGRFLRIVDDEGRARLVAALAGGPILQRFDFTFRRADGREVIGELNITPLPDGIQGIGRDVTEIRALQRQLADLALRDPLTGLANRRLLDEFMAEAIPRARRAKTELSVAFLDLDSFKQLNDTHGHDVGDAVLQEVARRMLATVRGADVVARIGGDEFVVVHEVDRIIDDRLLERIDEAISAPIRITDELWVRCRVSIGRASTNVVGWDPAALVAAADAAMYRVKRARHQGGELR